MTMYKFTEFLPWINDKFIFWEKKSSFILFCISQAYGKALAAEIKF